MGHKTISVEGDGIPVKAFTNKADKMKYLNNAIPTILPYGHHTINLRIDIVNG